MATVGLVLGATAGTAAVVGTAAVIGTVATAGSLFAQSKARSAARDARKLDNKRARLQSSRSAIQNVRQAQIARASVVQQGENQGVGGSSAIAGSAGSIQSQAGGNLNFANSIFGLQNAAGRLRESANLWSGRASGISQLGNFGIGLVGATS